MPSVTQVSMPSALTPSTMAQTCSRSRSLGERQAAPMQKRLAPAALAARASASTASSAISFCGFDAGVVMHALRAVAAILRTAAGLDRQQRGNLHLARIEILAVDALRLEDQLGKRQREQRGHFRARPVMADGAEIEPGGGRKRFGEGHSFFQFVGVNSQYPPAHCLCASREPPAAGRSPPGSSALPATG